MLNLHLFLPVRDLRKLVYAHLDPRIDIPLIRCAHHSRLGFRCSRYSTREWFKRGYIDLVRWAATYRVGQGQEVSFYVEEEVRWAATCRVGQAVSFYVEEEECKIAFIHNQQSIIEWIREMVHLRKMTLSIDFLCQYGQLEILKVSQHELKDWAFKWAARNGHTKVVQLLLQDPCVDPAAEDNYVIQSTAGHGHAEVVRLLLADSRVDPAANNNAAIRWAAENGHAKVVRLLLADSRVNPAANDNAAIKWAARNEYEEVVRLLLADRRVNPTAATHYWE